MSRNWIRTYGGAERLTYADFRVVLDKRGAIAGIYPVTEDGIIDAANSFPFVGKFSEGLFYLRTIFGKNESTHQYMLNCGVLPMASKIGAPPERMYLHNNFYSIGLNEFYLHRFETHEKCPECIMGQSNLKGSTKFTPLARATVQMDVFQSLVMSIKGQKMPVVHNELCTCDHLPIIDGYMVWKPKTIFSRQSRSGTAILLNSARCTSKYLWSSKTMLEIIGPGKSLHSLNQEESCATLVTPVNSEKMAKVNRQSISL